MHGQEMVVQSKGTSQTEFRDKLLFAGLPDVSGMPNNDQFAAIVSGRCTLLLTLLAPAALLLLLEWAACQTLGSLAVWAVWGCAHV